MYADTEMIIKDCIIYEKNTIIDAKKKNRRVSDPMFLSGSVAITEVYSKYDRLIK